MTSPTSFAEVEGWVEELRRNLLADVVLVLIGNKVDLRDVGTRAAQCGTHAAAHTHRRAPTRWRAILAPR